MESRTNPIRNLLFLTEGPVPAGQRNSRTHYVARAAARRHSVSVITPTPYDASLETFGRIHYLLDSYDLFRIRDRVRFFVRCFWLADRLVRQEQFDAIHGQGFLANLLTGILGRRHKIATVCGLPDFSHDLYISFGFPLPRLGSAVLERLDTWIARNCTALVVESQYARQVFQDRGVDVSKIHPLWHCTNLEIFNPANVDSERVAAIQAQYHLEGCQVVMYHGDIGYDDGVDILVEAARLVVAERKDVRFLVVGMASSEFARRISRLLREWDLAEYFVITGWQPYVDIPNFIACSVLGVAPYRATLYANTVFPTKTLEYLAMEKPVISTRLQAFASVFKDGEHLLYVRPEDPVELGQRILSVLATPGRYEPVSARGRRLVEREFNWEIVAEKELRLIEHVAASVL